VRGGQDSCQGSQLIIGAMGLEPQQSSSRVHAHTFNDYDYINTFDDNGNIN
jgi:hypothetical protein